jgi:RsiW-degrading membrane proteinase PrsW (M82 family)
MIIQYLMLIIAVVLAYRWLKQLNFDRVNAPTDTTTIIRQRRFFLFVVLGSVLGIVFLLAPDGPSFRIGKNSDEAFFLVLAFSLALSIVWMIYLRRLDVFEPEPWGATIMVFILSCCTIWLVWPIGDIMRNYLGMGMGGGLISDFFYCVVGIGMVEEFVKLIPLLVTLKFTKNINEPYDLIYYASISALGFAFIENAAYMSDYGLSIINARLLYACVAHMTFSSIVAYGIIKSRYLKQTSFLKGLLTYFALAALAHGFYDFWLLSGSVSGLYWITSIFFLITVHLWFVMKNNALNLSQFFNYVDRVNNVKLEGFLITSFLVLNTLAIIVVRLTEDQMTGLYFAMGTVMNYGFIIFYLVLSLSRFKLLKGNVQSFGFNLNALFPPPVQNNDYSGKRIRLIALKSDYSKQARATYLFRSMDGLVIRPKAVNNNPSWFLAKPNSSIHLGGRVHEYVLIRPLSPMNLEAGRRIRVEIAIPTGELLATEPLVSMDQIRMIGKAECYLIEDQSLRYD